MAAAAPDRSSEIAGEGATPSIEAALDLIVHRAENNTLDNIDDGDDEDEDEVDEDEYQYDDRLSPRQNELPITIVEYNKNMLDGHVEPGRAQAFRKRQHVSEVP